MVPFVSSFYAPFQMRSANIDHYVNNLTDSNRKLFNAASMIPIIRGDNQLGVEKEENEEKERSE